MPQCTLRQSASTQDEQIPIQFLIISLLVCQLLVDYLPVSLCVLRDSGSAGNFNSQPWLQLYLLGGLNVACLPFYTEKSQLAQPCMILLASLLSLFLSLVISHVFSSRSLVSFPSFVQSLSPLSLTVFSPLGLIFHFNLLPFSFHHHSTFIMSSLSAPDCHCKTSVDLSQCVLPFVCFVSCRFACLHLRRTNFRPFTPGLSSNASCVCLSAHAAM